MNTMDLLGLIACGVLVFLGAVLIASVVAIDRARTARPGILDDPDDLVADPKATDPYGMYGVYDRQGIRWSAAPLPPVHHRCRPWTKVILAYGILWYCPCGGSRLSGDRVFIRANSHRERDVRVPTDT
jgi:hypothetical protein